MKENKYSAMVYGYVSARRGYDGICYFSINLLSHTLKHNVGRDKTKGICFNFYTALKYLEAQKLLINMTDTYFTKLSEKNKDEYDFNKIIMYGCKGDDKDRETENNSKTENKRVNKKGFILIDYDSFVNLCLSYQPDILNLYLYIISHVNRTLPNSCCFTSIKTMEEDLGISRNSILKDIKVLEEEEYIKINNNEETGSNNYYLIE